MAKRATSTESRIETFAEDLGRMLGQARNKAEGWLGQREAIVKSLTELRDEASKLLTQLGHQVREVPFPRAFGKRGPGRPKGSTNAKKKRTMSAAARKK